jgi:hypothetical protein
MFTFSARAVDPGPRRSVHHQERRTPMKYMLLTYMDEKALAKLSPEEQQRAIAHCGPHLEKLRAEEKLVAGAGLQPTASATTIRRQEGKRLLIDGPFAETREQLAGYTIIEAKDLDEAIALASGFVGETGLDSVEVRPVSFWPEQSR